MYVNIYTLPTTLPVSYTIMLVVLGVILCISGLFLIRNDDELTTPDIQEFFGNSISRSSHS